MSYLKLVIVGNLGNDPELRYTSGGDPVCNFSVAVNRKWTGKDGQKHEETTWVKVAAWGKLAETCNQYLLKGRQVLVEGEVLKADAYSNKDGEAKASLVLTAQNVRFLGGSNGEGRGDSYEPRDNSQGNAPAPVMEDEIPF